MAGRRYINAVTVDNPLSTRKLYGRPCRFHGAGLRETTGTANALVIFHNGESASDPASLPFAFSPGQTIRDWFGESGIWFDDGVFIEVVSGSITGCVFLSELAADVFAETDIGDAMMGRG